MIVGLTIIIIVVVIVMISTSLFVIIVVSFIFIVAIIRGTLNSCTCGRIDVNNFLFFDDNLFFNYFDNGHRNLFFLYFLNKNWLYLSISLLLHFSQIWNNFIRTASFHHIHNLVQKPF